MSQFVSHALFDSDCNETCYAGKHECAAADEELDDAEPWKCINCLDCDQDFPTTCQVHGDQHVAFKCFFCCNIATFFCGGKTHFCEQCHKHGWGATPMKKGECRPGCDGRHPDHGTKKIHCLGCVLCRSLGINLNTKCAQTKERLAYVKVKKGLPHTAEEAAMAAEQIELDRLEAERAAAEQRAADVARLIDLRLSKEEAEALLDAHAGNVESAVADRRQVLRNEEEQRARDAARDAAVEALRAMGFGNPLSQLHKILISNNNDVGRVVDVLFEMQNQDKGKLQALVALGWNEALAQIALEETDWQQQEAEAKLKDERHRMLRQHPKDAFFSKRIAKIMRKQHFECNQKIGVPCCCKEMVARSWSAAPAASIGPVEDPEVEEISGAFSKLKKPVAVDVSKQHFPMARCNVAPELCDVACDDAQCVLEKGSENDSYIAVVSRRKNRSDNEKAHAGASESSECCEQLSSIDGERHACGGGDDEEAPCLVEEFCGAFSRPRPAAKQGAVFEKLK